MATIAFPEHSKLITLPSGPRYSILHIHAQPSKPTLLFLHGFPSSSYDWRYQITHFSAQGYGVLAPDLLGYGETDRPTDASAYRGKKMVGEIIEILDAEKLDVVHGIAHDWGSYLLGRLANYYPHRLSSVAFLAVEYRAPGSAMDLDAANRMTKQAFGYETYGYWKFVEREDAGDIIRDHFDSFFSITYAADPELWKTHLGPQGALEAWAKSDQIAPMGKWMTEKDKTTLRKIMRDDYGPAMNWYRAAIWNLNLPDETAAKLDPRLKMPAMLVLGSKDAIARGGDQMKANCDDLRMESMPTGHWMQLEMAEEVNGMLAEFLESVEKGTGASGKGKA